MCLNFLVRFNKADWKAPGKEKKKKQNKIYMYGWSQQWEGLKRKLHPQVKILR